MIKVSAAVLAGVVDVGVAVGRLETVAGEPLALADDAPAAAGDLQRRLLAGFAIITYSITGIASWISGDRKSVV